MLGVESRMGHISGANKPLNIKAVVRVLELIRLEASGGDDAMDASSINTIRRPCCILGAWRRRIRGWWRLRVRRGSRR